MGWQATGWAFKAPIPNPGAKFVLVALAERAGNEDDDHDWTCYPSIETISAYTAQGYRTIQRHLDWLEQEGFISRERRTTARGRKGAYNFTLHRVPTHRDKVAGGQSVQDDRPNGPAERAPNGQTEPVKGTSHRTEANASTRGTRLAADWEPDLEAATMVGLSLDEAMSEAEVFRDYWRACVGHKGVKADWPATWRNWCRRKAKEGGRNGRGQATGVDYAAERHAARVRGVVAGFEEALDPGRRQRWRM